MNYVQEPRIPRDHLFKDSDSLGLRDKDDIFRHLDELVMLNPGEVCPEVAHNVYAGIPLAVFWPIAVTVQDSGKTSNRERDVSGSYHGGVLREACYERHVRGVA